MTEEKQQTTDNREQEYLDGWKRAKADYENLLKEVTNERLQMGAFALAKVVEEFLPVYDHLKMAIKAAPTGDGEALKNWRDGITHIASEFAEVLKRLGVQEIIAAGEKFDPAIHETVGESAAGGVEAGTVIRELESGYRVNNRVIKPAKVIIAK
ncbi:MAG: grpE [Candidatus Magasanikbacteria bacterium]|nr:grpE [Candidatus Magasanikbacteria bacterium]